jgi:hypothetical protein
MTNCAFWICGGKETFYHEAIESARRLSEVMPELDRFLFSDKERTNLIFHKCVKLPKRKNKNWYLDSVIYFNIAFDMLGGYDSMLYLDTDTFPLAPFPEMFEVMDRFDVAGIMGSRRITGGTADPIPFTFPEFEIGVTVFKSNEQVKELLKLWRDLHWEHPDLYGKNDQRSFREALWMQSLRGLRILTMPCEYGLRWPFGSFMSLPVKILHGRTNLPTVPNSPTIEDVARIVNEHTDMRTWSPRTARWTEGVIPPDYEGT